MWNNVFRTMLSFKKCLYLLTLFWRGHRSNSFSFLLIRFNTISRILHTQTFYYLPQNLQFSNLTVKPAFSNNVKTSLNNHKSTSSVPEIVIISSRYTNIPLPNKGFSMIFKAFWKVVRNLTNRNSFFWKWNNHYPW